MFASVCVCLYTRYPNVKHTNKYAGAKNFSNPIACRFFRAVARILPPAFRSLVAARIPAFDAVVLVLVLFPIQKRNKLVWIVSCNPTIRLFVALTALGIRHSHRAYPIFSYDGERAHTRTHTYAVCRSRLSNGYQTLLLVFLEHCVECKVASQRENVSSFFCAPKALDTDGSGRKIRTRNAIKSHLHTEFERILRLIRVKIENYFQMRFDARNAHRAQRQRQHRQHTACKTNRCTHPNSNANWTEMQKSANEIDIAFGACTMHGEGCTQHTHKHDLMEWAPFPFRLIAFHDNFGLCEALALVCT